MIDLIVLHNAIDEETTTRYVGRASTNLGLVTIRESLIESGFPQDKILLWPERRTRIIGPGMDDPDLDHSTRELVTRVGRDTNVLSLIPAYTEEFFKARLIVEDVSRSFLNGKIIMGAPHFREELGELKVGDRVYRNPIQAALEDLSVDGIMVGHIGNVGEWLTKYRGDWNVWGTDKVPGSYKLDGSKVIGGGEGSYPEINRLPYVADRGYVKTVIRDGCGGGCGHCVLKVRSARHSAKTAIATLDIALEGNYQFELLDSNPFWPRNIEFYTEVFEGIIRHRDVRKAAYLHASLLVSDEYRRKLVDFFVKHNFTNFGIGRDYVEGQIAEKTHPRIFMTDEDVRVLGYGRKGRWEKDQTQLDNDRGGIEAFIDELKQMVRSQTEANKHYHHADVKLHYILTPFETEESALALFDEMERFKKLSSDEVTVTPRLYILAPLPGTQVKYEWLNHIHDPEAFVTHSMHANSWKYCVDGDRLKGAYLIDKVVDLMFHTEPEQRNTLQYFEYLRKVTREVFSSDYVHKKVDRTDPLLYRLQHS